jgi:CBS domain-containing protein
MKIENVMTRRVVAARADTDLGHVARLMWENDCGSVPVVDAEDKVVGMVTDRDAFMGAYFGGRTLRELRAAGCMASELVTCLADESAAEVVERMGARRVRRMPVTDAAGRLVGIVSLGDLVNAAARAQKKERKTLQEALTEALASICAQPSREEVLPALPAKRPARAAKPAVRASGKGEGKPSGKAGKSAGRKRSRV